MQHPDGLHHHSHRPFLHRPALPFVRRGVTGHRRASAHLDRRSRSSSHTRSWIPPATTESARPHRATITATRAPLTRYCSISPANQPGEANRRGEDEDIPGRELLRATRSCHRCSYAISLFFSLLCWAPFGLDQGGRAAGIPGGRTAPVQGLGFGITQLLMLPAIASGERKRRARERRRCQPSATHSIGRDFWLVPVALRRT